MGGPGGVGPSVLSRDPRAQIVGLLHRSGALTRTDLAARLGVSPAMVSEWIADLVDAGLIEPAGTTASRGGRPAQQVKLAGDAAFTVGLTCSDRR